MKTTKDELIWETAAPLLSEHPLSACRSALPFQFDDTVTLCDLPEWARSTKTTNWVHERFGASVTEDCSDVGLLAATKWKPDPPIVNEEDARRRRPDYLHRDLFHFASVAVWLVRPSAFAFRVVMERDHSSPATLDLPRIGTLNPFRPLPGYGTARASAKDLERARDIYQVMVSVKRPSVVFTALRCAANALAEELWDVRNVLLWMGVEALFATTRDKVPATQHLLARLMHYMAKVAPGKYTLATLEDLYAERSDIVHGARFGNVTGPRSVRTTSESEEVLSLALQAILADASEVTALCGPNREQHLEAIAPANSGQKRQPWTR